ncbi:hypothetical protein C4D60_Mb00t01440 [Musa balbisiana]|uniref:CDC20/Fizzy WD40 domain-containing protein n=1 Tax=Musa balbisiana TaxID=52838 RepID=A0A4V4H2B0_MUSBA|nr:hypothetical protein C4D60_Mb00t01440 [Musa balbisiana]
MCLCSLKWSGLSGRYLASGGHDKLVHIWDACMPVSRHRPRQRQWLHRISSHTSIVKAVDWCPTRSNLLASGGGCNDHCVKFWNTINGACLNSIDAGSEVCALLWDKNKSELLTSHGSPNNQLTLWNYPSMTRVAEVSGHSSRVLSLAGSPLGGVVASAAADETVRFWNIFETPKITKPELPFARFNLDRDKQEAAVKLMANGACTLCNTGKVVLAIELPEDLLRAIRVPIYRWIGMYRPYRAHNKDFKTRSAIPNRIAWYGRYVSVRQATSMWTVRYRAVHSKKPLSDDTR